MSYATDTIPGRCTAQMRYASPLGPLLLVRTKDGLAGWCFCASNQAPARPSFVRTSSSGPSGEA